MNLFKLFRKTPKEKCQWPNCRNDALCASGNVCDALMCREHLAITNGKTGAELTTEELVIMTCICIGQKRKAGIWLAVIVGSTSKGLSLIYPHPDGTRYCGHHLNTTDHATAFSRANHFLAQFPKRDWIIV